MNEQSETPARLVLASASPRRRELLRQVGVVFRVVVSTVDETVRPGESPAAYVLRVAREKASEVLAHEESGLTRQSARTFS